MAVVWNKPPFRTAIIWQFHPEPVCLPVTGSGLQHLRTKLCFAIRLCDWNLLLTVIAHAGRTRTYKDRQQLMHFCGVAYKVSPKIYLSQDSAGFLFLVVLCELHHHCCSNVLYGFFPGFPFLGICWSWMVMWFWNNPYVLQFKKTIPLCWC